LRLFLIEIAIEDTYRGVATLFASENLYDGRAISATKIVDADSRGLANADLVVQVRGFVDHLQLGTIHNDRYAAVSRLLL
jgi:hypothetical protein